MRLTHSVITCMVHLQTLSHSMAACMVSLVIIRQMIAMKSILDSDSLTRIHSSVRPMIRTPQVICANVVELFTMAHYTVMTKREVHFHLYK